MLRHFIIHYMLCLLAGITLSAQDLGSPVDHPIILSGNFGELRTSHFHTGIDIKSHTGDPGDPILSVMNGYVSRIKVQAAGYGNVVYVNHPNGTTSVYAHLDMFRNDIAEYVRSRQYELQSFEIDIWPPPDLFPVLKGTQIGEMGNTGYSFGTHLHFELRDTKTEKAIDPVIRGLPLIDNDVPGFRYLVFYEFDESMSVQDRRIIELSQRAIDYKFKQKINSKSRKVGIGIVAYDNMRGTHRRNGISRLNFKSDEALIYGFSIDSLTFGEGGYLNAHMDYQLKKSRGLRVHRCFLLPGNKIDIYEQTDNNGMIELIPDKDVNCELVIADHKGNSNSISFVIGWDGAKSEPGLFAGSVYNFETAYFIEKEGIQFHIPAFALYENTHLEFGKLEESSPQYLKSFYLGNKNQTPFHLPIKLNVPLNPDNSGLHQKTCVVNIDEKGPIQFAGKLTAEKTIEVLTKTPGTYALAIDTTAPSIRAIHVPHSIKWGDSFVFEVKDDYRHNLGSKAIKYEGSIDGEWTLVSYDYKRDRMEWLADMKYGPGDHLFALKVIDPLGNTNSIQIKFTISE